MYAPAVASTQATSARRKTSPPRSVVRPTAPQVDRGLGNQATLRLLTKSLTVGAINDPLEDQADRVADEVMRMPDPRGPALSATPQVSRKCSQCEAEEEQLQKKEAGASEPTLGEAPASVDQVLRSPYQSMDTTTRGFFESRFGHDFTQIRVHADEHAANSAAALGALAYTVGNHIAFARGQYAPETPTGKRLIAHELTHVVQQQPLSFGGAARSQAQPGVRRKCDKDLGAPAPCVPSKTSSVGWEVKFKPNCDDLLPGEEANLDKLKPGNSVNVHGFSSQEGAGQFSEDLSCHRANKIAALLRDKRADCPVIGTFHHGNTPGLQSVIVEEVKPALSWEETWLDPTTLVFTGNALYDRASKDPTTANLDVIASRRLQLKKWMTEDVQKTLGAPNASFHQKTLDEYRRLLSSAEDLWVKTDQLLALHKHAAATTDTFESWAKLAGADQDVKDPSRAASNVPTGAKYHIDLFGEGRYPGAINIGDTPRKTTTGVSGSRVPNLIYRHFSNKDPHVPIADHVADLVTSENGPVRMPGLAEEIARIIAPGGIIILYNPISEERYHDDVAKAVGGTVKKDYSDDGVKTVQTTISAPAPMSVP